MILVSRAFGRDIMADKTKIEWADSTFNPWEGCQKVSPACDNCYAEARNSRFGGGTAPNWGPHAPRRRTSITNWRKPIQWQRQAKEFHAAHGRRRRVFCASLADVFDNAVDPSWRMDLWQLIELTPDLNWMLLTKRPQNIGKMLPPPPIWDEMRDHVWLGATCEDAERMWQNIYHIIGHGAAHTFISYEPALGPLNGLWKHLDLRGGGIDWVIAGGESGPNARPSNVGWFISVRDACQWAGVPFLFKQRGEHDEAGKRVGRNRAGRLLDGVEHNGFPTTKVVERT